MIIIVLVTLVLVVAAYFITHRSQDAEPNVVHLLGMLVGSTVLVCLSCLAANCAKTRDHELWNGRIIEKTHGQQGCCHCHQECSTCVDSRGRSYDCMCHEVCAHSHDYYWGLQLSTGDDITVDRCEPNRYNVPDAWTRAKIGEPAAVERSFTNYLKSDPESLRLRHTATAELLQRVPPYPGVWGFYHVQRFLQVGGTSTVAAQWQWALDEIDADLGHKKQVNVMVVATWGMTRDFASALEERWLLGKKNDFIVVLGLNGTRVDWVESVTLSRVEELRVGVRDLFLDSDISDVVGLSDGLRRQVDAHFIRTPMAEFEYLDRGIDPPVWMVVVVPLVLCALAAFISLQIITSLGSGGFRGRGMRYRQW